MNESFSKGLSRAAFIYVPGKRKPIPVFDTTLNLKVDTIPLLQVVRDIYHSVCSLMLVTGTFLYVES